MSSRPFKKNQKECFLALDVGTEAVKALVFEKKNQECHILGAALEYFDESKPFDNDKVLLKVKEEAIAMSGNSPKGLLMCLPANILRSRVDYQTLNRKNPKKIIDGEEGKKLHQYIFEAAKNRMSEQFAKKTGILPQDVHFIDLEIIETKADGYEIPDLAGYGGRKLEFRILASFLPKDDLTNFGRLAEKLGLKLQRIINPIKNLPGILKLPQAVFLDVGGKITQVCLIRNNKIDLIDEFRIGGRDFTRAISETLNMRYTDARILKEKYSRNELTGGAEKRIKEILISPCGEWSFGLKSKLKNIKGLIPPNFLLLGGGSQLPEIRESAGGKAEEAKLIYPKDFENIIDNTHSLNTPQFINSISLFYAR